MSNQNTSVSMQENEFVSIEAIKNTSKSSNFEAQQVEEIDFVILESVDLYEVPCHFV